MTDNEDEARIEVTGGFAVTVAIVLFFFGFWKSIELLIKLVQLCIA